MYKRSYKTGQNTQKFQNSQLLPNKCRFQIYLWYFLREMPNFFARRSVRGGIRYKRSNINRCRGDVLNKYDNAAAVFLFLVMIASNKTKFSFHFPIM